MRFLVPFIAGVLTTLGWPFVGLRLRSLRVGHRVSPWTWGQGMGRGLYDLLGTARSLQITGDLGNSASPAGGLLLLGAHLGPWEAGAAELARRGYRPMVLAAPWPRLPLSAQALAARRAELGVVTATRGRRGWRAATLHLRAGGTVVALVDSLSALRPGRRPLPFIEDDVGAPDALLAWAERQGARSLVALGHPGGFLIEELTPPQLSSGAPALRPDSQGDAAAEERLWKADHCVRRLREAVEAHPASWAWIRALALLVLMLPVLSLSACPAPDLLPPIPKDPDAWVASAEELVWTGTLGAALRGRFVAASGEGRWKAGGPEGQFDQVKIDVWSTDTGLKLAEVQADLGRGRWPQGPASFEDVHWALPVAGQQGQLDVASWSEESGWSCGGCPLELLQR